MKKILCLVSYTYLPAKTGGQKSIASFYENLSKHFKITCIGTENNDASKASYEMKNFLSSSPLRYINIFNFFRIMKIIKHQSPEYFELEHPYLGWLAVLIKNSTSIKLIVRSHNIEGLRFKNLNKWWWSILMKYEGWVHRNADINYFISDEDRLYAIKKFKLEATTAYTITFGINQTSKPSIENRSISRKVLIEKHGLSSEDVIILFNGAFDYKPNTSALYNLVQTIFPLLKTVSDKSFKLIVCGKDIPKDIIESTSDTNIIFAGFVPDINAYLYGTTIFVNPITEGGGIKTKLVEALGFNLNCVSFKTGAIGVSKNLCGEKLLIVEDNQWMHFAQAIIKASDINIDIPQEFYDHFSNEKIMEKIKGIL